METVVTWRFGEPVAALAERLRRGGVAAIPTESSYGLAVDPRNPEAVERVYRIKGRDRGRPLPVVIADRRQLAGLGIDPEAPILRALGALWPGPLSLVVPLSRSLPAAAGAGSLAVRVPGHERLRSLLAELGMALTATSANASGEPPILDPEGACSLLAAAHGVAIEAVVVDGGRLPGGPPSTLVRGLAAGGYEVLRPGAVPAAMVEAAARAAAARRAAPERPAAPPGRKDRISR